jgi:hypothetical protein
MVNPSPFTFFVLVRPSTVRPFDLAIGSVDRESYAPGLLVFGWIAGVDIADLLPTGQSCEGGRRQLAFSGNLFLSRDIEVLDRFLYPIESLHKAGGN